MEPSFNLIDEAWVCVMREDGATEQLSLRDTLLNAQDYRALAGETPTQDVAMLRLLLAVLYAALFGEEQPETLKEALNAWVSLWKAGQFPQDPIRRYLERWHERFWLFHEQFPFMQIAETKGKNKMTMENAWEKSGLCKAKGKPASGFQKASKLNGAIMESLNRNKFFNHSTGEDKDTLSFPAAARWLVHVVSFDDGGIKPYYSKNTAMNRTDKRAKCTVAWPGSVSPIYAEGKNLFETLLLNLVLRNNKEKSAWDPPHPTWERESPSLVESEGVPVPNDPAALYTMPFRRILRVRRDERVLGFLRYVGEGFIRESAHAEQMTVWTQSEDKKGKKSVLKPRTARMPAQMWRELTAITVGGGNADYPRPGVVQWISLLVQNGILPWGHCTFHYVKALYDVSQSSTMTEVIEDRISFSAGLLAEAGRPWNNLLSQELSLYKKAALQLGRLARDLLDAEEGKVSEGKNKLTPTAAAVSEEAQERFYYSLDTPFRKWLVTIRAEDDSEERHERVEALRKTVLAAALRCGQELLDQVGPSAFVKRYSYDSKKKKKVPHITAPEAWGIFRSTIYKLLREG